MGEVITITDQNMHEHMAHARGLVPRDPSKQPMSLFTAIKPFPDSLLVDRSTEYPEARQSPLTGRSQSWQ